MSTDHAVTRIYTDKLGISAIMILMKLITLQSLQVGNNNILNNVYIEGN